MSNNPERCFEVSLPRTHALNARIPEAYDPATEEIIPNADRNAPRTEIEALLKQAFQQNLSTLRETRFNNEVSYFFAVRAEQADAFRQKISELGLTLKETANSKR